MDRRAVVVEDDPAIRSLIRTLLGQAGYGVIEAGDGRAGIVAVRSHRPDIVLLDIGLPDVDGLAVLHALKQEELVRDVPVIMVTAWTEPETIQLALDRGATDYVCKPFDGEDLVRRVERVTRRSLAALFKTPGSGVDPVTSLGDHDHLELVVERQATAARRIGRTFSVLAFAVDQLPDVRHAVGTAAADELLHAVAERLRRCADVSDVMARWDRDSLAVVVPGAGEGRALAEAACLRDELAALARERGTRLTASIGVAEFEPPEHADETVARAVAALEAAGGDAIRLAEPAARPAAGVR